MKAPDYTARAASLAFDALLFDAMEPAWMRHADGTREAVAVRVVPYLEAVDAHAYFSRRGRVAMLRPIDVDRLAVVVIP